MKPFTWLLKWRDWASLSTSSSRLRPPTQGSRICAFFAEQEHQHEKSLLEIAETHRRTGQTHYYSVDVKGMLTISMRELQRFLAGDEAPASTPRTAAECLKLAAQVEARSIRTYTKMTAQYSGSFAQVIGDVLEEERKHLQLIRNVSRKANLT